MATQITEQQTITPPHLKEVTEQQNHTKNVGDKASKRIEFIDLAKGICILLVVLNHAGFDPYPLNLLRMPLYYILSGLFFKDYGGYLKTIVKKTNKLIIPCLFFYSIAFLLTYLICVLIKSDFQLSYLDIFTKKDFHNVYLWFLISLFWTNTAFLVLKRTLHNERVIFYAVLAIGVVGYFICMLNITIPFFIDSVFLALPYFYFGYLLRKTEFLTDYMSNKKFFILFAILLVISISGSFIFGEQGVDFRMCTTRGSLLLAYVVSISFVCLILLLTKVLKHLPVLSYLGRYSLIVLGLHFPIQYVLSLIYKNLDFQTSPLFYFIPMVGISLLMIPIFIKCFPYFTAQKDLIKYNRPKGLSLKFLI